MGTVCSEVMATQVDSRDVRLRVLLPSLMNEVKLFAIIVDAYQVG